jgi:sugar phosphate isomerase/epimerase
MPAYSLGCHTYVFSEYGYDQAGRLGEILDTVADAGYPAVELCNTSLDRPDWYEAVTQGLRRNRMRLVGASHGGPLWDAGQWDTLRSQLEAHADKLARFGSGMKCGFTAGGKKLAERTDDENCQMVYAWTELARMFQSKGVALNYHTHGEPLADIEFVVDNVPADLLPLGPDLDWLRFGGTDPIPFLRAHAERLVMLHVRDYWLGGTRTWHLGEGDADYAELARALAEIGFTGDFVVELAIPPGSDPATRPIADLLRRSRETVREAMGL